MFEKIKKLKEEGYTPSTIIDIGAYKGLWTDKVMEIYPDAKYYLFEGIDYEELDRFEKKEKVKVYKNILLNDKIEEVEWYEERNTGDSFFKETSKIFNNTIPKKRKTIDMNSIMERDGIIINGLQHFYENILIKIDCQGAEIPILKGSSRIWGITDFIILEMPLFGKYNEGVPNFSEHIKFMNSIGFIPYQIMESHYINNYNMQVDIMFVNKNRDYYSKIKQKPQIYSTMLTNFLRTHVINYVTEKKKKNPDYKVIDIGGSAKYTNWSHSIIDYIVDINKPNVNEDKIKYFAMNVNYESEWKEILEYVEKNGKFDFCICSHIIEDISLPQVMLNNLNKIAKEGFIGIPSKYRELSKVEGEYMGYIHHRWIYSIKDNKLLGFPKVNFIESEKKLIEISNSSNDLLDLSFFWKNGVPYKMINDNYLGPTANDVKKYYDELLEDDVDEIKKELEIGQTPYHINYIKTFGKINGDFINVKLLTENIVEDLKKMEDYGFIPFDIKLTSKSQINEMNIIFINKNHEHNIIVQRKLLK